MRKAARRVRKRDEFILRFKKTDSKACATLPRDWERLVSFFDYPQAHWIQLRTTNIVESPFASMRLRTDPARRFKKTENAEAMIWKLLTVAERSWRKLNAPELMREVYEGKPFKDGKAVQTKPEPTRESPEYFNTPIDKTSPVPPLLLTHFHDRTCPASSQCQVTTELCRSVALSDQNNIVEFNQEWHVSPNFMS